MIDQTALDQLKLLPGGDTLEGMDFTFLPVPGNRVFMPVFDAEESAGSDAYAVTVAQDAAQDYMQIRMPGRGSKGSDLVFRWIINPRTLRVSYKTLDSQSFTRSGYQFGVWGDDLTEISMEGQTAGFYFADGLTDLFKEYSLSYRNLLMLQSLFLNNGSWFEGESLGETKATRERIRYHEDVQLIYNNFLWFGMFTNMSVESSADHPYFDRFTMTFVAWKERYRSSSPWRDSIHNSVYRGHIRGIEATYGHHPTGEDNNGKTSTAPALTRG
jgi:hypothetical protein